VKGPSSILLFLKQIIRKIRTFLKSSLSREVLIFLIFLLISCVFWILQNLQTISEVEMDVPIIYSGVPLYNTVANELPKTLKITLRDKGTNLYHYYRHRGELAVHVDFQKWYRKDGTSKIPCSIFDPYLRNHLSVTTQLLRIQPDTISVFFTERAYKVVPVHLNSNITLSVQHMLSNNPEIYPSSIIVYAPKSVLNKLSEVETSILKVRDLNDSSIFSLSLVPIPCAQFSKNFVEVHLNVEEFTEQSLMIPVTGLNFPLDESLRSFPSSVKVSFFVGLSAYSKISQKDFQISVDRSNLLKSDKNSQKILLIKSPANISNLRIQPETVDCLIEKK
jgi:YbbR domain-containing protein